MTATLRPLHLTGGPANDWDDGGENGGYFNKCAGCGADFIGHKRRVTCRACADRRSLDMVTVRLQSGPLTGEMAVLEVEGKAIYEVPMERLGLIRAGLEKAASMAARDDRLVQTETGFELRRWTPGESARLRGPLAHTSGPEGCGFEARLPADYAVKVRSVRNRDVEVEAALGGGVFLVFPLDAAGLRPTT